jgi:redox-sensitive bicupin YhaK (pirin superfamily)
MARSSTTTTWAIETLPAGEFQLMSAGSGVTHSEYNPSNSEVHEFLQIWIQPNLYGIEPGYQQKRFNDVDGLQLIASPDARDGSLLIHQDASFYPLRFENGGMTAYALEPGRSLYVHVVSGEVSVDGTELHEDDDATIKDINKITFDTTNSTEALIFDLP